MSGSGGFWGWLQRLFGGGASPAAFDIDSFGETHPGKIRTNNQDRFLCRAEDHLWVVADGMGGHEFGERAAELVIEEVGRSALPPGARPAISEVVGRIERANERVVEEGIERGASMGSTVVALSLREGRYGLAWVGDSRAYVLREGKLYQLSHDHTHVQDLIDAGQLDPAQAHDHPMAHVLSRVVGVNEDVGIDTADGDMEGGDIYLLCSDGLHSYVPESEIVEALKGGGAPQAVVQDLLARTLDRGAPDNVTIVAVQVAERAAGAGPGAAIPPPAPVPANGA